jgi:hypothetical protein
VGHGRAAVLGVDAEMDLASVVGFVPAGAAREIGRGSQLPVAKDVDQKRTLGLLESWRDAEIGVMEAGHQR